MAGKEIKPIDKAAIHRICSGQVVLDLATAVKELVENSLDAGATSIEVRLKDYGAELIEVADNGSGVSPENYQGLTLKYHTSKISDFSDLQSLSSFGFRGEALSSLCALGNVSIVTRTKDEAFGTRLVYDHSGVITSEEKVARAVGTTVSVGKLFSTLPVRHKEFNRNIRREYGRLLSILQAYALIAKGVKLVCSNQTGRGGRTTVVQTQGNSSIKDNIVTVFGVKTAGCMEWLDLAVTESCYVEGFISKPGAGCGRAAGDRQFFYVNNRPVDMPKVAKLLNELYKSFNSLQYPMVVLNFVLPTTSYDVNVTPDKRKVFLHSESELMVALRESLEKVYSPNKYIYAVNDFDHVGISDGVSSVHCKSQRSGKEHSVEGSPSDKEESISDHEEDDEDDGFGLEKGGKTGGKKIPLDRFSADLSSFQRKSSSSLNNKKATGTKVGSSTGNSSRPPGRKVQATLSACLSKRRRDSEGGDEGLLSEEPLLKKWNKGVPATKRTDTVICEEDDDLEDEQGNLTNHTSQATDAECTDGNTLSESDTLQLRDGGDASLPTTRRKVQADSNIEVSPTRLEEDEDVMRVSTEENGTEPSEVELDADSNKSTDKAVPELGVKCHSGAQGGPQTTILKAWDDQRSVISSSSKPESVMRPRVSSGIDVVAKGLADMRKKLGGGSNVVSSVSDSRQRNLSTMGRVELNVESATTTGTRGFNGAETRPPPDEDLESADELQTTVPSEQGGASRSSREGELSQSGLFVQFDIENLRKNFQRKCTFRDIKKEMTKRHGLPTRTSCFTAATLESGDTDKEGREKEAALAAATSELERSFNKADFKRMQVLGQFNLGFILTKIDQDIFIVDQHASDEKYNFERLTKNTVLNKQPLLRPLPLELSAADEITVITHLEVFRKNGFDFIEVEDAPTGQKLRLSAVPFSQNVTFGIGDVQELISLLADESVISFGRQSGPSFNGDSFDSTSGLSRSSKWLPRPSRVRAMLASRACRSSTMIGDSLSRKEMERILSHLSELDSPWNCPHGRPTMRHLVDLSTKCKQQKSNISR
ncbi:hypothetical protein R1sor_019551 [Riccia sorocarpa]|uniref:Uncharacterized protein n=1 Tax=Riccia sorocarpa TaxID=122646 RepID=A0ABD3IEK4_9MARC